MSLVKSVSVSGDDVFDEDVDDITLQNKEWKHNMEKRVKDGYVEGIDTAKAKFLQLGFNLGYREGAEKTVALGRLKGVVSAIQCWCQQRPAPHNSSPVSVSGLLQRVEQHEERLMKEMRQALEKPPMATSSSDSLGVHPGEEEDGCCGRGGKEEGAGGCGGAGEGGGCGKEGGCCGGGGGKEGGCCGGGGGKEGGCCGGGGGKEGGCCGGGGGEGGGCCGGGGGEGGGGECKKTDCCQKGGEEKMEQEHNSKSSSSSISSFSSSRSFDSRENLYELLQACEGLVEELGLPRELIEHLQLLRSMA